jgi:hypothetical protein
MKKNHQFHFKVALQVRDEGSEEGCVFPLLEDVCVPAEACCELLKKIHRKCHGLYGDLTRPICQISPGAFFSVQTSSQRGKLTLFPSPHGEGEWIIL